MLDNHHLAKLLSETATLLELKGENVFRVSAYRKAADSIKTYPKQLAVVLSQNDSEIKIEGVGSSILSHIKQVLKTGSFDELDKLRLEIPPGLIEMTEVQGLGPKKIATLWHEAGIVTIDELYNALANDQLASLKGFGGKTRQSLLAAVAFVKSKTGWYRMNEYLPAAQFIQTTLAQIEGVESVTISGEARRNAPVLNVLTFVVVIQDKVHYSSVLESAVAAQIVVRDALGNVFAKSGIALSLNFCSKVDFVSTLIKTTCWGAHLDALKPYLKSGLATEEEVYKAAGLAYIPPPMRENKNELALAKLGTIPKLLLVAQDLKGILHAHSTYSDGRNTLKEMALACIEAGYSYLGITDHSQTAVYAGGLSPATVLQQHSEIDELNQLLAPFRILKGIESDILSDGSLDYTPEILQKFDFVIASIHSGFKMTELEATNRLIKAIENPATRILGHPTGRLLLNREGYNINHKAVIDACAVHKVSIEINANPWRLDLDWEHVGYAIEKGVKIAICPDAHSVKGIADVHYGVAIGQKAGLTAEHTLNTLSLAEIISWFARQL